MERSHAKGRQAEIPTTRDDPAIGRWMSVDPLAESTPFLTPYHYVRNNPLYFIDPDGLKEIKAANYAKKNLIGLTYGSGISGYPNSDWQIANSSQVVCNEFVAIAYREAGHSDFPVRMDKQVSWFKDNGWFTTDKNAGEIGDALFFGDVSTAGKRHVVLIADVKDGKNGQKLYRIMGARNSNKKSTLFNSYNTIDTYQKWFGGKKFAGIGSVQKENNESGSTSSSTTSSDWKSWINKKWGWGPSPQEMWNSMHHAKKDNTSTN